MIIVNFSIEQITRMEIRGKNGQTLASSHGGGMPTDENFERQVIKLDKDENIVRMELCALNCLCFVGVETDMKREHKVGIEKSNKKSFINLD